MNRIKSGPGPLRKIYEQISALQYDVGHLKSELRLVKRKLNNYEPNKGSVSVKDAIVDRIRKQQFSVTLTPVSDESVNIVHLPSRILNQAKREPIANQVRDSSGNIYVNEQIFDDANDYNDFDNAPIDEAESDAYLENEQKVINPNVGKPNANTQNQNETYLEDLILSPDPKSADESLVDVGLNKKTKPLNPIWKKYEVTIDSNGKKLATCRKCGNKVSAESPRLKIHYAKNCPAKFPKSLHKAKSQRKRKPRTDRKLRLTGINASDPEHIPMTSGSGEPGTTPKRKRVSEVSEDEDESITGIKGNQLDPIWSMFDVSVVGKGQKYATCRICGIQVSGRARRLRRHIDKNCSGSNNSRSNMETDNNFKEQQEGNGGSSDSSCNTPEPGLTVT